MPTMSRRGSASGRIESNLAAQADSAASPPRPTNSRSQIGLTAARITAQVNPARANTTKAPEKLPVAPFKTPSRVGEDESADPACRTDQPGHHSDLARESLRNELEDRAIAHA